MSWSLWKKRETNGMRKEGHSWRIHAVLAGTEPNGILQFFAYRPYHAGRKSRMTKTGIPMPIRQKAMILAVAQSRKCAMTGVS